MAKQDPEIYYVPEKSRKPILMALAMFLTVFGAATTINHMSGTAIFPIGGYILFAGLVLFVTIMFLWFRTAIMENLAGLNNEQVKQSYVLGMSWFIFSEVMFFFGFFFALAYVRNFAVPWLGGEADLLGTMRQSTHDILWNGLVTQWPLMETPQQAVGGASQQLIANNGEFIGPHASMSFPGWLGLFTWLPLWNTVVLLTSSFTVHIAHLHLKNNDRNKLTVWLGITVLLGITFILLQYIEYHEAYNQYGLTLQSGIYGTTFFMLTGFHGFHVIMGTVILLVMWLRSTIAGHFSPSNHFGFEAASWYWHFVDVVWVCLFIFVYIL